MRTLMRFAMLLRNSGLVASVFRRGVSGSLRRPRPLGRRRGLDAAFQQLEPRLALATRDDVGGVGGGLPMEALDDRSAGPRVVDFAILDDTLRRAGAGVRAVGGRDRMFKEGDRILFRLTFNERVIVSGTPMLPVAIGGTIRDATLVRTARGDAVRSRSGGDRSLLFSLQVQRGDLAPNGLRVEGDIGLPAGAAIRDRAGNDASVAISRGLPRARVDAVGPRITEIGSLVVTPKSATMRVTFNESVQFARRGTDAPTMTITIDGVQRRMTVDRAASRGTIVMFRYQAPRGERLDPAKVVVPNSVVEIGSRLGLRDAVGNAASSLGGPTAIVAPVTTIPENMINGADLALLLAVDRDGDRDSHTFTLVAGAGDGDNARFTIEAGRLRLAGPVDFESRDRFSIRLRATDSGGLSTERAITLTVTDIAEAPTAARAGLLVGSTVFADWNNNGVHDWLDRDDNGVWNSGEGERWGRTDANGRVAFDAGDAAATLRVLGGRDAMAGTDLITPLSAPAGSAVINSLTTLIVATQASSPGKSVAEAAEIVRDGLGLVPGVDLLSSDPLASNNVAVLRAEAAVAAVLATGEREGLATARVAENLARHLTSVAAQPPEASRIDLRDVGELAAIFQAPGSPLPEATVARLANENSRVMTTGSIDQLRQTRTAVETIRAQRRTPQFDYSAWISATLFLTV